MRFNFVFFRPFTYKYLRVTYTSALNICRSFKTFTSSLIVSVSVKLIINCPGKLTKPHYKIATNLQFNLLIINSIYYYALMTYAQILNSQIIKDYAEVLYSVNMNLQFKINL